MVLPPFFYEMKVWKLPLVIMLFALFVVRRDLYKLLIQVIFGL